MFINMQCDKHDVLKITSKQIQMHPNKTSSPLHPPPEKSQVTLSFLKHTV